MKYNRIFCTLALVIILSLLLVAIPATPALAQTVTVSPISGPVGTPVTVSGTHFTPSATVQISFPDTNTYVTTTTTNNVGTFSAPVFTVGAYPAGTKMVWIRDVSTGALYAGTFTIIPNINLNESSGYVDDEIEVSGTAFNTGASVTIYFDNTIIVIDNAVTDSSGTFTTTTFAIPESYSGSHTVKVRDGIGNYAEATLTVLQQITVTPALGAIGDTVTISGTGFAAGSAITFYFDNSTVNTKVTITNANGSFINDTFTIPSNSQATHTIKAQDVSHNSATAAFTTASKITISPTSGFSGTTVTVTGTGFSASTAITIKYDSITVITGTTDINTDTNGSFSGSFNVPAGLTGVHSIEATDGLYYTTTSFVSTADSTISQTTSAASPGYVGMELTIAGAGFEPDATITVTYAPEPVASATVTTDANGGFSVNIAIVLATVPTDANGAFSVVITIPPSGGGNHIMTVTDDHTTKQFTFVMESEAPLVPPLLPEMGTKVKAETYFDWEDIEDISGVTYTLQIATDENFTEDSIVLEKKGLTDSEYTITEEERLPLVEKEDSYYWRIKAVDGASNESWWSDTRSFRVDFSFFMPRWAIYTLFGIGTLLLTILAFRLIRKRPVQLHS